MITILIRYLGELRKSIPDYIFIQVMNATEDNIRATRLRVGKTTTGKEFIKIINNLLEGSGEC